MLIKTFNFGKWRLWVYSLPPLWLLCNVHSPNPFLNRDITSLDDYRTKLMQQHHRCILTLLCPYLQLQSSFFLTFFLVGNFLKPRNCSLDTNTLSNPSGPVQKKLTPFPTFSNNHQTAYLPVSRSAKFILHWRTAKVRLFAK